MTNYKRKCSLYKVHITWQKEKIGLNGYGAEIHFTKEQEQH